MNENGVLTRISYLSLTPLFKDLSQCTSQDDMGRKLITTGVICPFGRREMAHSIGQLSPSPCRDGLGEELCKDASSTSLGENTQAWQCLIVCTSTGNTGRRNHMLALVTAPGETPPSNCARSPSQKRRPMKPSSRCERFRSTGANSRSSPTARKAGDRVRTWPGSSSKRLPMAVDPEWAAASSPWSIKPAGRSGQPRSTRAAREQQSYLPR